MRQGFAYIRLQIYVTLLALILGSAVLLFLNIVQKNIYLERRLQETLLVQNVLDQLAEDWLYAESYTVWPDNLRLVRDGVEYVYLLNSRRLARKKESYLYLTPAELALSSLRFSLEDGLLQLVLTGETARWERWLRR